MAYATSSFEYNWADELPSITFVVRGATKSLATTDVNLNSVAFERVGAFLESDLYDSISGRQSDNMQTQAFGIVLGILRILSSKLITGTTTPDIVGLQALSASHTIGANNSAPNGGFMTLRDVDKAIMLCAPTDGVVGKGAATYALCNPKTLREFFGLMDANSRSQGISWEYDADLGVKLPFARGVTWLFSDSMPLNETKGTGTNLTSIYFFTLGGTTGLKLLYARDPKIQNVNEFGVHQYPISISKSQNRKGLAVEAFYALFSPERATVSRLNGINPTQFAI